MDCSTQHPLSSVSWNLLTFMSIDLMMLSKPLILYCPVLWLLCPWDFPGKNAGVVCISFSRGSSQPKGRTHVSCIGRWILYHWVTRETLRLNIAIYYLAALERGLSKQTGYSLEHKSRTCAFYSTLSCHCIKISTSRQLTCSLGRNKTLELERLCINLRGRNMSIIWY